MPYYAIEGAGFGRAHRKALTDRNTLAADTHPGVTPRRVLLVDDDPIVLEIVALLLSGADVEVTRASDGGEAIGRLTPPARLPDVVLADHQMPGISGSDIARHVQSLPEPRPRVIAMSASPLSATELALFDDFLAKPVDADLLRAAIAGHHGTPRTALPAAMDSDIVSRLETLMPPDAIQELYTVYVDDTRRRIGELECYSAVGDADSMRRCAHALKGAAAMAGVSGIASIAAGIEAGNFPRKNDTTLFHQLRSACDDVEETMIKRAAPTSAANREVR